MKLQKLTFIKKTKKNIKVDSDKSTLGKAVVVSDTIEIIDISDSSDISAIFRSMERATQIYTLR